MPLSPHYKSETALRRAKLRKTAISTLITFILATILFLSIAYLFNKAEEQAYAHGYNNGTLDTNHHWITGFYNMD
jgi:hypothetical protein